MFSNGKNKDSTVPCINMAISLNSQTEKRPNTALQSSDFDAFQIQGQLFEHLVHASRR